MTAHIDQQTDKIKTIGEFLRKLREDKHISIAEISTRTKISITMLELLEDDQLGKLPNKAYVLGYVKSYAKELGTNQTKCLEYLDQTYEKICPTTKKTDSLFTDEPALAQPTSPLAIASAIIFVLVGLVVFIYNTNQDTDDDKKVTTHILTETTPLKDSPVVESVVLEKLEPKVEDEKSITEQEENKKEITATTKKTIEEKEVKKEKEKEKSEAVVKKDIDKKETKKEETNLPEIEFKIATKNLFSIMKDESKIKETMVFLPDYAKFSIVPNKQNVFIFAATGDTWLTYKKDDDRTRKFLLEKGKTLYIRGDKVRIFFGNVNATKIFLNNKPLKIVSSRGVKSLVFPLKGQKEHPLPLFVYLDDGSVITSNEHLEQQKKKKAKN